MSVLRRLFGGSVPAEEAAPTSAASTGSAASGIRVADDEQAYERELMRAEADRLASDLLQRQIRYADRSWTPPAQGGERRADDAEAGGPGS